MKVLICWFMTDNFGDNLIHNCFRQILRVVIQNIGVTDYTVESMSVKDVDVEKIKGTDIILFAGGGLFGFSYLDLFDSVEDIVLMAEKNNIPVIFSSIGVNNDLENTQDDNKFTNVLRNPAVRAVSVRENLEFFKKYCGQEIKYIPVQVADPVTWCYYIYKNQIKSKKPPQKTVGINVVRGGLFADNVNKWKLEDEIKYLNELKGCLDAQGISYKFYTNGSALDENTLNYYTYQNNIPSENVIKINTCREFVNAINGFDFTVCIRMHSSIVSYALSVPSVNLVWNEKIRYFYDSIGQADRTVEIGEIDVNKIVELIKSNPCISLDSEYLMTVYNYLFENLAVIFNSKNKAYTFEQVCDTLVKIDDLDSFDEMDMRVKLDSYERNYAARFRESHQMRSDIWALKGEVTRLNRENERLSKTNKHLDATVQMQNQMKAVRLTKKYRKIKDKILRK